MKIGKVDDILGNSGKLDKEGVAPFPCPKYCDEEDFEQEFYLAKLEHPDWTDKQAFAEAKMICLKDYNFSKRAVSEVRGINGEYNDVFDIIPDPDSVEKYGETHIIEHNQQAKKLAKCLGANVELMNLLYGTNLILTKGRARYTVATKWTVYGKQIRAMSYLVTKYYRLFLIENTVKLKSMNVHHKLQTMIANFKRRKKC